MEAQGHRRQRDNDKQRGQYFHPHRRDEYGQSDERGDNALLHARESAFNLKLVKQCKVTTEAVNGKL